MANNFKNAVISNVSSDEILPSIIYTVPDSKKSIAIELDISNNSSAGQNVTVIIEDENGEVERFIGALSKADVINKLR